MDEPSQMSGLAQQSRSDTYYYTPINICDVIVGSLIVLILMGFIKGLLGLLCSCFGTWGISKLLMTPRRLDEYFEEELRAREVEYDDEGWPVHPDTRKRTVQLVSRPIQFLLNLIIFICLPGVGFYELFIKTCRCSQINQCGSERCHLNRYDTQKEPLLHGESSRSQSSISRPLGTSFTVPSKSKCGSQVDLSPREMDEAPQVAAGLAPQLTRSSDYYNDDFNSINICDVVVGSLICLVFMGFVKGVLGLMCTCIGTWGISKLLMTPRKLDEYIEDRLQGREVVYDEEGWPVHPDTRERTVHLVSRPVQFILNLIIFICMPFVALYNLSKSCSCSNSSAYGATSYNALQRGESQGEPLLGEPSRSARSFRRQSNIGSAAGVPSKSKSQVSECRCKCHGRPLTSISASRSPKVRRSGTSYQ